MTNKLFLINDLSLIPKLKALNIQNFVYPLSSFCVGVPSTFLLKDIKEENAFIYINRVLDTKAINNLKKILKDLPSNIKGVIFEDISLIEILKECNIQKILYANHYALNYESINYYFDYVDDIILSNELNENEIDLIIKNSKKEISLLVFGLISSFYSRRLILSNYAKHYHKNKEDIKKLYINDNKFISIENDYGTVIYHYPYFNGKRLINKKMHYAVYLPILLNKTQILNVANNNFDDIQTDEGFLDINTYYKVK